MGGKLIGQKLREIALARNPSEAGSHGSRPRRLNFTKTRLEVGGGFYWIELMEDNNTAVL